MKASALDPVDVEIGGRVRELRQRATLNQHDLAKVLGLPQSVVSRIESGERPPLLRELDALARALDVPVSELFPRRWWPIEHQRTLAAGVVEEAARRLEEAQAELARIK